MHYDHTTVTVGLKDQFGSANRHTKTTIDIDEDGILCQFDGFGERTALPGNGKSVLIEMRDGVPHVVVWADINQEDPTHVISLAGAAESNRKE